MLDQADVQASAHADLVCRPHVLCVAQEAMSRNQPAIQAAMEQNRIMMQDPVMQSAHFAQMQQQIVSMASWSNLA